MKNQAILKLFSLLLFIPFLLVGYTPTLSKDIESLELKTVPNEHHSGRSITIDDKLYVFDNDLSYGIEYFTSNSSLAGVDLALSITPSNPAVDIYKNVTLSLTVNNTGSDNAGSFVVDFPTPTGLAFVSQNVPVGTYSNWNGKWNLPGLNAGQSVTMELTLFTLTTDPINIYAEVESASEADTDSTPGNGTAPIVNEDDETLTTINGGNSNCSFTDFNLVVSDCQDNGTSDPSDDYFTFTVLPTGINLGNTYTITGSSAGGSSFSFQDIPYTSQYNSDNQLLSNGDIDLQIIDSDGICVADLIATIPSACIPSNSNPEFIISFTLNTPRSVTIGDTYQAELFSENYGTGSTASFSMGFYLSEDNMLSSDDQQLGSFSYSLDANSSELINPSFLFPDNLTSGKYFLLVKTDDNDVYLENDESDNEDLKSIEVWNNIPLECEKFGPFADFVVCSEINTSGNIDVISVSSGNYLLSSYDQEGNLLPPANGISYQPIGTQVVDNEIRQYDDAGNIISSIIIPTAIVNGYDEIVDADELSGGTPGYVLAAYRNANAYSVFLDANLNLVSETELIPNNFTSTVTATGDGGAMVGAFNNFPTLPQGTPTDAVVHKVSADNQVEYNLPLPSYLYESERVPCSTDRVKFTGQRVSAGGGGSNYFTHYFEVEPTGNGDARIVSFKSNGTSSFNPVFEAISTKNFYQEDGSRLEYKYYFQRGNPFYNIPEIEYYRLTKFDQNDNIVYEKNLEEDVFLFTRDFNVYEIGNDEVIFVGQKYDGIWLYNPDCNDTPPATCDNNLLTNPGYEDSSVSANGWYSLGGTSITSDANSGDNALLISGSAPGGILQNLPGTGDKTYTLKAQIKLDAASGTSTANFISLKFLSSSWQPIYTQTVTVFPSSDFEEFSATFTAPPNTAYVEAKAFKGSGNYDMIVDDWCLIDGGSVDPCANDTESPMITFCSDDITVYTTGTSAPSTFRPSPTFTDNCGASITSTPPYASNYEFPLGNTTLTYVIADAAGNEVSCSYDIVVIQQTVSSCAGNLVVNPGFENGLDGWSVPTGIWEITSDANSGQQALALAKAISPPFTAFVTQSIPVNGNKRYSIEAYIQVAGPGTAITAQAYDSNNNPLGSIDVRGQNGAPAGYSPLSLIYDTPSNASTLELRIVTVSSSFTEIDDVCITESEIPVSNGVDLELNINTSINSFDAWEAFDLTVAVQNTGTETADNIIVDFPEPDGVVFQGGNEYTASQGTYNPYSPQEWNVGSLAAGETAVITFHLFTTQASNPIVAYAQVLSMDQSDSDSTPGNGICCTPNEDDEAVVAINPSTNSPTNRESNSVDANDLTAIKIFPNPANDWTNLVVDSPKDLNSRFEIYDLKGSLITIQNLDLTEGLNQIQLDLSELEAGMYFAIFPDEQGRKNRIRFTKID